MYCFLRVNAAARFLTARRGASLPVIAGRCGVYRVPDPHPENGGPKRASIATEAFHVRRKKHKRKQNTRRLAAKKRLLRQIARASLQTICDARNLGRGQTRNAAVGAVVGARFARQSE